MIDFYINQTNHSQNEFWIYDNNPQERYRKLGKDVSVEFLDSDARALIALQGPKAITALEDISSLSFKELYFMQTTQSNIAGVNDCRITRCGYTGVCTSKFANSIFLGSELIIF